MIRERGWSLLLAGLSDPWRAASSRAGRGSDSLSTHTTTDNTDWPSPSPSPYRPAFDNIVIDLDLDIVIQGIVLAGVRTSTLSFEPFESNTIGIYSSNGSHSQKVRR
jgi:hypothetical protein